MKQLFLCIGLFVFIGTLTACNDTEVETSYTITFEQADIDSVDAKADDLIDLPFLEDESGFFLGWEDTLGNLHKKSYTVESDMTLTPIFESFEEVLDLRFDEEQGSVAIVNYTGSAEKLILPHMIDGSILRTIGMEAFKGTTPREIHIPMTVYRINMMAFKDMPNLEEVHFYGEYLGTVDTMMSKVEFEELLENNPVCQTTQMDTRPTEENPWIFDTECPVSKVTSQTDPVTIPDGQVFYAYHVEIKASHASALSLMQHFGITPFMGCDNLRIVTLPDKYSYFDPEIFHGVQHLERVHIENNPSIYSSDGVLYEKETDNLLYYPSGLLTENFTVPAHIKHINSFAFFGDKVKSLTMHNTLTFDPGAFAYLTTLKDIYIEGEHSLYKAIDGVLYTSDGTKILVFPSGKETTSYSTPSTINSIGELAFMNQQHIEHLVLSEGLTTINDNAFLLLESLQTLDLASTVEYIGPGNFAQREKSLDTIIIRNTDNVILAPAISIAATDALTIYVPDGLIENYKSDMWWQRYQDNILPLSTLEP